jgi:hypothetical protein
VRLRWLGIGFGMAVTLAAGIALAPASARSTRIATTTTGTTFSAVITNWTHSSARRTANFYFVAHGELASSFTCDLDEHGYVTRAYNCLSPQHYKRLRLGVYTFSVYAVDSGGVHSTTASRNFTIN